MAYCFKVTVKSSGHFLPKGYTFQVIHSQRTLDNAAVNNAAAAEYQKLNGGKKPCSAMYLSSVDVVSLQFNNLCECITNNSFYSECNNNSKYLLK